MLSESRKIADLLLMHPTEQEWEHAVSAAAKPQPLAVKVPGDNTTVINLGSAQVSQAIAPKPAKVIRAADLSSKSYLETEVEVEEYLVKLKAELLAAIRAGQRARIQ